jgi:hypothetical protein
MRVDVALEHSGAAYGPVEGANMPTVEQSRAYATNYKILAADPANSARRASVLTSISRSWTALAHQFENLATIVSSEG